MAGRGVAPVWTPDSERIVYAGRTNGPDNLHWIRADGGGSPELLLTSPRHLVPGAWTPDGRHLLGPRNIKRGHNGGRTGDLSQDVVSKSPSTTVAGSSGFMGGADVSPDGRWVAYESRESGQLQVHVDAYPGPGPRYQVSTDGGALRSGAQMAGNCITPERMKGRRMPGGDPPPFRGRLPKANRHHRRRRHDPDDDADVRHAPTAFRWPVPYEHSGARMGCVG